MHIKTTRSAVIGVLVLNNPLISPSTTSAVSIGIQGLPNLTAGMISGGLYVLIAELPSARFPLLAGGLGSALKAHQICNVIIPTNPELFIRRVESFDSFNAPELIAKNQLNFFVMQEEFPKKMFRFGADSFVKELEQFEIPENSYLLFDQADELLSLHDISLALDQIDILRKWFDQRKVTALLVFSRSTAEHSGTINALMDHLTGIARLSGDRDGLEITFDYWQSPEGTITARNFPLLTLESGLYEASNRIVSPKQVVEEEKYDRRMEVEDAEPCYFYMDPDLDSLTEQLPGAWQRVDTPIGMMHATRNRRLATCILSFDGDSNLQQLAETIHTLRVSLGRHALLVVQEKEASLGHQSEALLLRLGINLVVHRDVSTARLPALLESIKGQVFKRDIETSFETAVESAFPPKQPRHLPALAFTREINVALDRAEASGEPCAMVTGKPMPGITVVDILTNNVLTRPGDMMSSDGKSCYIFLNACPQSEILVTLEQILGMAVDTAFDDPKLFIQREEIQPELEVLLRAAERGEPPDTSSKTNAPKTQEYVLQGSSPKHLLFASIGNSAKDTVIAPPASSPKTTSSATSSATLPATSSAALSSTPPLSAQFKATQMSSASAQSVVPASTASAPVAQAARSSRLSDLSSEEPVFNYDSASNASAFGKKEAPRATRSVSKKDAGKQANF